MKRILTIVFFALIDLIILGASWSIASLSLDISFGAMVSKCYGYFIMNALVVYLVFGMFGVYASIWKYAGFTETVKTVEAFICIVACNFVIAIMPNDLSFLWAFVQSCVFIALIALSRVLSGYIATDMARKKAKAQHDYKRVIIVGAGDAGALLVREMKMSDKINMDPVCFLDDDPEKLGKTVNGVKVLGQTADVYTFSKLLNVDEIILAMPSASEKIKGKILGECQKTGCKVMTVPGIYQLAEGQVSFSTIKEVSIEDLLGRSPVTVNLDEIMGYIENKVVLVTGGGGSIGSELCRQISKHNPKRLIIFDIYENNAYDIQQELLRKNPALNLTVLIGSVRDSRKVDDLFSKYKPNIVFHAAAHKHVPLMEDSPNEAVKNNVAGTYKVADAAGRNGAERFILISTDKAVNPTNVMGATKRICEMIIQTMNKVYEKTNFVAVRFGNVLGSNGSVIPLFKKQIEEGGPVTVTHKDIVRYFMTIPEAVSLVLQAGAYAKGGEIFVLDMGDQVRIYDLALNMIRLSGLVPFKDIDVKVTGLRPGEKLFEERLMDEEGMKMTANNKISIGKPIDIDESTLFSKIKELYEAAYDETLEMKRLISELVPTYKLPQEELDKIKDKQVKKQKKTPDFLQKEKKGAVRTGKKNEVAVTTANAKK